MIRLKFKCVPLVMTCVLTLLSGVVMANPIGIITAVPDESQWITQHMRHLKSIYKGLYHYHIGTIHHKPVVVINSGTGIVNAAVATTQLIMYFHPRFIIMSGTAGATYQRSHVGDVMIVKQAFPFDLDNVHTIKPMQPHFSYKPVHNQQEPTFYQANSTLVQQAKKLKLHLNAFTTSGKVIPAGVLVGTIATSDHFPNDAFDEKRLKQYHISLIAMETASVMKVCWLFHVPVIAFRAVSDLLAPVKHTKYNSWNHADAILASDNAAKIVVSFIVSSQ